MGCWDQAPRVPRASFPPSVESLGSGATWAAAAAQGWRVVPALAPTRQMASLSPCDWILFCNFWLLFRSSAPSPLPSRCCVPWPPPLWEGRDGCGKHCGFASRSGAWFSVTLHSPWCLPCGTWQAGSVPHGTALAGALIPTSPHVSYSTDPGR